ncbi:MAG TPA: DNA polymerase III subunit delta [Terriglobia bacterium]|nr:DNA polymerase III subunit delta [Terriglobia bacterium]
MKFPEFEKYRPDPSRNVFVFVCADEFLIQESRGVWPRLFGGSWVIDKMHAKEFEAIESSRLADDARTPSLFSESKAYIVARADKLTKGRVEDLADLANVPQSSIKVILSVEDGKGAQGLAAFPRVSIDPITPADAARWVVERYKVAPDLARYVVEHVGSELYTLYNEMEKLRTYAGSERPLETRDVDAVILRSERFGPWELDDAILARSYARSVRLVGAMIEEGEEPLLILAKIARVWRQVFVSKGLAGRVGAAELAAVAGAPSFKGAEIAAACRRYEWKRLAQGFRAILAADRAFKSSNPNPEIYFDVMLWKLMDGKSA